MENAKFAPLDPINRMQEILEEEIIKDIREELEETDRLLSMANPPNMETTQETDYSLPEIYPVKKAWTIM